MLVIADENMPHALDCFSQFGEVRRVAGRKISPETVRDADLLMVRSITKVGRELLEGSRVRFVGTATIGTDHIDQAWLAEAGIGFASAPGCNAESVAQWMAAALAWQAGRAGWRLADCSVGVVGAGNCGGRVARVARAMGMNVLLNDPPLARRTGDSAYRPLEALMECDFLALHVPLTRSGDDPTWRLIDAGVLDRLKPGAVIVNACRGFVVDEAALCERLDRGRLGGAILDAWEDEPSINPFMAKRALLGTPHIAGYSYDGKVNGSRMIAEAACEHFNMECAPLHLGMPEPTVASIRIDGAGREFESVLTEAILTAYPIHRDDADLRRRMRAGDAIGAGFDALRKHYPLRREFRATRVQLRNVPAQWPSDWSERLRQVGFDADPETPSGGPA
jgi:erythronate-4-phosphate dehydrogenase